MRQAARQERARISSEQARISDRISQLRAELASLERVDQDLADQARLLDELISKDPGASPDPGKIVLRGAAMREQALTVLVRRVGIREQIGYRDWYRFVRDAGFVVLAKRPLAAFLTTVSRSPMVMKGTEPGTYYIEPAVLDDLRRELAERSAELSDVTTHLSTRPPGESPLQRHRLNLMATVRRLERQIDEGERILAARRDAAFDVARRAA